MKVVLTGATGFLGWHTRLRLRALSDHQVIPVTRANWHALPSLIKDADVVIHVAGVNRADDPDNVRQGNVALAENLASALTETTGTRVVYANSTQAESESPYGRGKATAADKLARVAEQTAGTFVDVRLPNLFGEHCRPRYNSFVATFVDAAARGEEPAISDNEVPLLHAQDAAQSLIDGMTTPASRLDPSAPTQRVRDVWELLVDFASSYRHAEFPDLSSQFRVNLFNTYRAALFPDYYPIRLTPHTDPRGTFVETVRSRGGEGQSSISTTAPGVTRGEHFHLHKIERFVVVEGEATINLRRMFHKKVVTFRVSGDHPATIDMPTGWVHNITNVGEGTLITQFWTHELFRPSQPDTYTQAVRVVDNGGTIK